LRWPLTMLNQLPRPNSRRMRVLELELVPELVLALALELVPRPSLQALRNRRAAVRCARFARGVGGCAVVNTAVWLRQAR